MFSFRVFHNGIPSKNFNPQRDCRQEDSIPLFLFIHSPENSGISRKIRESRLTEKNVRQYADL